MRRVNYIKILLIVLSSFFILTACGEEKEFDNNDNEYEESERRQGKNNKKKDNDNEEYSADAAGANESEVEKNWDFEISPYGMPELQYTDTGIEVFDDNHEELAKALEETLALPEYASSQTFAIYRVDDAIVSIKRSYILGDASVSRRVDEYFVFSTMGELLTLDNVGDDIINNCYDLLEEEYDRYKTDQYDLNVGFVDLIDEDTPWIIDANSIAFFLDSEEYGGVPYRIYFENNPYINPKVIPSGNKILSFIANGYFAYGDDVIGTKYGSIYNVGTYEELEPGLYIKGNDYNYIYDIIDSSVKPINGIVTNDIYINDECDLYVYTTGYYREENEIGGDDKNYYYGIFTLEEGELKLLGGGTCGRHYYDTELQRYTYDDDYYSYAYTLPYDEFSLEIFIMILNGE